MVMWLGLLILSSKQMAQSHESQENKLSTGFILPATHSCPGRLLCLGLRPFRSSPMNPGRRSLRSKKGKLGWGGGHKPCERLRAASTRSISEAVKTPMRLCRRSFATVIICSAFT